MEVGCSTPQLKALTWCLRSALSALTTSMSMVSKRTCISPSGELTASQEAAAISRSPRGGYPSRHDGFWEHAACRAHNRRIARTRGREVRMETVNVAVRMERQTRDDAAKLFSELGISTTQAINMFLKLPCPKERYRYYLSV